MTSERTLGDGPPEPPPWPFADDEEPDPLELLRYLTALQMHQLAADPGAIAALEQTRASLRRELRRRYPDSPHA